LLRRAGGRYCDGPHAKLTTKHIVDELEQAVLSSGVVAQTVGGCHQHDGESRSTLTLMR
jgi:hypothetical protein